jgi:uncharacterized OB-fold protein
VKRSLNLDYSLSPGALAPYIQGLVEGTAMAKQCARCARVTFPPERMCQCQSRADGATNLGWRELSGEARLVVRTDGPNGAFALVQFNGADNQAVCRIVNPELSGSKVTLQAAQKEMPGIFVEIVGEAVDIDG